MAHHLFRSVAAATAALTGLTVGGITMMGSAQAAGQSPRYTVSPAAAWTTHLQGTTVPATRQIHAKVWLAPRDAAALKSLVTSVSNPSSAAYGDYLSASAYRSRFAPTDAEVSALSQWLTSAGLSIEGKGPDNHFVAVAGAPAAIDAAFTAGLRQFTVHGDSVLGPTTSITVPGSIGAEVLAVTGLDTLAHQVDPSSSTPSPEPDIPGTNEGHRVSLGAPPGFVNAPPCSSYYGEKIASDLPAFGRAHLPYAVCGYVPAQLRDAYGLTASGLTGTGQAVAITDAFSSPWLADDANTYAARHGEQTFAQGQLQILSARGYDPQRVSDCGGNGWYGEQSLDVEAVHGTAPDAGVLYYGAASCYDDDLMAAMAQVVSDNVASLVSNSWGEPTVVQLDDGTLFPVIDQALVDAYEAVFMQGAVQGIGFYFSSGDGGDDAANWGVKQTEWPTSDPLVTSVGGTSLAIAHDGGRSFETGWGTDRYSLNSAGTRWQLDGFLYGAGGGCSDWFTDRPGYQAGITGCTGRAVPDVAMDADPTTGMLVGETQDFALDTVWGQGTQYGEYRIGGTSLASPLMAGLNAAAQQGRGRIGFANPMLYTLYRDGVFFDVTAQGDSGNVRVDYLNGLNASDGTRSTVRTFDDDSSLATGRGWDEVTGVGSPTERYIKAVNAG